MAWKSISIFVMVGVCFVVIGHGSAASASASDEVNAFYRSLIDTLKKKSNLKDLVALVEKNPRVAERCLTACQQKAPQIPGEQGKALRMVHEDLQAALLLSSKSPKCDADCVQHVLEMIGQEDNDDERILWLKRLVNKCPQAGDAYIMLGDLCCKQNRWGETIAAYEKGINLTGNQSRRSALQQATKHHEEYLKQKPVQPADVKDLFSDKGELMGPAGIVPKAIQRQILFDEWSSRIKEQFFSDLKVIGEGLKGDRSKRLLIEGHTDKRGPLERNKKLSEDRAESIRGFLVQNCGIDPSQLTTKGCGPTRPYSPDDNEAGWALNRRVEFKKVQ